MNLQPFLVHMDHHARAIEQMTLGISAEQAQWKPTPDDWSLLEVICHLADEEREDFRTRVGWALGGGKEPWHSIDPQGWVTSRGYNQRELTESITDYLAEREASLAWLAGLSQPDWTQEYPTPWGTTRRAGDFMAAWVAHDLLHLRQLVELRYAWTIAQALPYNVQYAGEW
ncbi:MAG TPA: DinB family protein [Caldilineaceae bacterium]|nr:DinB family protein [Caldilineaceae bacterium]